METKHDYKAQAKIVTDGLKRKKAEYAELHLALSNATEENRRLLDQIEFYKNNLEEALLLDNSLFLANQREADYQDELERANETIDTLEQKLFDANQSSARALAMLEAHVEKDALLQKELALRYQRLFAERCNLLDEISDLRSHYTDLLDEYRSVKAAVSRERSEKEHYIRLYERLIAKRELSPVSVVRRSSPSASFASSPLLEISGESVHEDASRSVISELSGGSQFFSSARSHVTRSSAEASMSVYARVVRDGEDNTAVLPLINAVKTELTPREVEKFLTEDGLPVISPSGQTYALSCVNNVPKAVLMQADVDHYTLAVTIINMIDNVLSKGNVVKVNTPDPFIAEIARLYIDHLKENTEITITSSNVMCPKAVTPDIAKDALTQFRNPAIVRALDSLEEAPWYEEAMGRSQLSSSLSFSA